MEESKAPTSGRVGAAVVMGQHEGSGRRFIGEGSDIVFDCADGFVGRAIRGKSTQPSLVAG